MFKITAGKGMHIKFHNGWTVSIQFGPGNYCDNHDMDIFKDDILAGKQGSTTAECAVMNPQGKLVFREEWEDSVGGYMTPEQVVELLCEVAKK